MSNQINFSPEQVSELQALVSAVAGLPDTTPGKYRDAYNYVNQIVQASATADDRTKLFFSLVSGINNNDPSPANLYIRSITTLGLQKWKNGDGVDRPCFHGERGGGVLERNRTKPACTSQVGQSNGSGVLSPS